MKPYAKPVAAARLSARRPLSGRVRVPLSIHLRLTLLSSAILVTTLIAFSVILYLAVAQAATDTAHAALSTEIRSLALTIHRDPDRNTILVPPPGVAAQNSIQLRGLDGTVIYQSSDLQAAHYTLPLDAQAQQHIQSGAEGISTISIKGKRLLLGTVLLLDHGTPFAILQVAGSLQQVDQTLATLRQDLLLGSGFATLLAFGAGWVLAGTALRPINHITRTAQEIGATQDFGRRVAYAGPPDQVGRLAGTFNTMLARLQSAYQVQRRFVGDASHELRTPLTTIRGNVALLQHEPPIAEADRVAVLADLASESERLSRLVGNLLTLARSDAGRPLQREPITLRPLLASVIRQLAVTYPERAIYQEGQPDVTVLGDPDALTQVVFILLDNALKFTPGDGTVVAAVVAGGDHVSIAVRDTGPGIAPDALPHIFERFYQGDTARTGTGTGLGLAIAKVLVEGQGGTIEVESVVGRGSTFTVKLPRATATQVSTPVRVAGV